MKQTFLLIFVIVLSVSCADEKNSREKMMIIEKDDQESSNPWLLRSGRKSLAIDKETSELIDELIKESEERKKVKIFLPEDLEKWGIDDYTAIVNSIRGRGVKGRRVDKDLFASTYTLLVVKKLDRNREMVIQGKETREFSWEWLSIVILFFLSVIVVEGRNRVPKKFLYIVYIIILAAVMYLVWISFSSCRFMGVLSFAAVFGVGFLEIKRGARKIGQISFFFLIVLVAAVIYAATKNFVLATEFAAIPMIAVIPDFFRNRTRK